MQLLPTHQLVTVVSFAAVMLHLSESTSSVITAVLGNPVTLQCAGRGMALKELNIHWSTPNQVVARFSEGKFYSHPAFENRVHLPKSLEEGDFSLTIKPTFYSDHDIYECYQAKTLIKKWDMKITASYSSEVRVSEGSMALMPCYSHVDRQLTSNNINLQWKKGDIIALDFHNGKMDRVLEYSFRTTVEVESVPKGDFSLRITDTQTSDSGVYQCLDNHHRILSSVTLDVYKEKTLKLHRYSGESLIIVIPALEVQIEFTNSDSSQWLCSVLLDWAVCRDDSYSRFQYKNGLFSVKHLTKADEGRYIVKTANGYRTIKEVYVKVSQGPPRDMYACMIICCLILLVFWMRKILRQKEKNKRVNSC